MKRLIISLILVGWGLQTAFAGDYRDPITGKRHYSENYVEGEAWKEDENIAIPSPPKEHNLVEFEATTSTVARNQRFFLDKTSLSLGKDEVSRYLAVIQIGKTRNVFYDGIRCATGEVKKYAYGVGDQLKSIREPKWEGIKRYDYLRKTLRRTILCDGDSRPRKPKQVIQKVQYGN